MVGLAVEAGATLGVGPGAVPDWTAVVAADVADDEPYGFVAVTAKRNVAPTSPVTTA
jgi:hypothetical protein